MSFGCRPNGKIWVTDSVIARPALVEPRKLMIQQSARKRLFSVSEAAQYLGRTACAVREMVWAGKLPSVRFDRRIFLDVQDLDEYIEKHKVVEQI